MSAVQTSGLCFLFVLFPSAATVLRLALLMITGNFSLARSKSIGWEHNVSHVEASEQSLLDIVILRFKREGDDNELVPPDHVIPSKSYRTYGTWGRWAKFKFNFLEIGIVIVAVINIAMIVGIFKCCCKWFTRAEKTVDFSKKYGKKYMGIPDDEEDEEEEEGEGEDDEDDESDDNDDNSNKS